MHLNTRHLGALLIGRNIYLESSILYNDFLFVINDSTKRALRMGHLYFQNKLSFTCLTIAPVLKLFSKRQNCNCKLIIYVEREL